MAQSLVTDAGTLVIPGAYSSIKVEQSASGLATTGVLLLVGEAEAGPDYSSESDLSLNAFGPDQMAEVLAKYKSGNLVDAFRGATQAANDPDIQGSFSRAILVKTNVSGKASTLLAKYPSGTWGTLQDKSWGKLGNLIYASVTAKTAEVIPTTGPFTFLPPISSTDMEIRVNGGAAVTHTIGAQETPTSLVTALGALTGVAASGGVDRQLLGTTGSPLAGSLSLTVVGGNQVTVTFTATFGGTAVAGDTLWIPTTSVLASGGAGANAGAYVVLSATSTTVSAVKLLDASGVVPDAVTPPTNKGTIASTGNTDLLAYSPVTVTEVAGNPIAGAGKSLEISALTSAVGLLSDLCYNLTTTKVTWISKSGAPYLLTSAAEYVAELQVNRNIDNITEDLFAGGAVALQLGYIGTTATVSISAGTMTIVKVGGAAAGTITIKLADYPTIGDLANYIASLPNMLAAVGTASLAAQPSTTLDAVTTVGLASKFGTKPGRLKQDSYKFVKTIGDNSVAVQITGAAAGLPAPSTYAYLTGGSRGGSTDTSVSAAIDALERVRGNFVVPLFSRDAADDSVDGLTDSGSTYTIDAIHVACRSHVLKMSTLKRRRNRQAFLSHKGTFANNKLKAANMASFRCSMTFEDAKDQGSNGIAQFQPWMSAVKAASMQAAGFYRPIVHKFINISGALQAAGDWTDQDDTQVEDALIAGLLPIGRAETGGYRWISDQTTYGKDNNFVFNSIQATYVADVVALSTAKRMEDAFVGQSVADVSAPLAKTVLEAIMADMKKLKLIAASDDAPRGFKNAQIKIQGPSMIVSVEIKLAGAIYFIPITFLVTQVSQTAGP